MCKRHLVQPPDELRKEEQIVQVPRPAFKVKILLKEEVPYCVSTSETCLGTDFSFFTLSQPDPTDTATVKIVFLCFISHYAMKSCNGIEV
jgi:hypothetical protein